MRTLRTLFINATLVSALVLAGCSSFSATIISSADAGTSAGASAGGQSQTGGVSASGESGTGGTASSGSSRPVGGAASTIGSDGSSQAIVGGTHASITPLGGVSSIGGTSALGGIASLGGTSALGGITSTGGATTSASGGTNPTTTATGGVSPSTGGVSGNVGGATGSIATATVGTAPATGGMSACAKAEDCVNPDPVNCSYTCMNPGPSGTCKPSVLTSPTQCATDDCAERAISGFWSDGKPYIAYGFTESDGSGSIRMQPLKLDGTREGEATVYRLPMKLLEPKQISAAARATQIAFLWEGTYDVTEGADLDEINFAFTDIHGTSAASNTLMSSPTSLGVQATWLRTTQTGAWLAVWAGTSGGPVANWYAAGGSTIASWTDPDQSPVQYQLQGGLVGNTLMLTGASCPSLTSTCVQKFVLQRYSTGGLMAMGPQITLSQNVRSTSSPVMNSVQERMAVLWTEEKSPGLIFSAIINEDGTFARPVATMQSAIQPKAIVESIDGGGLLIGTVTVGSPAKYQVVAQRLDASLGFVGSPLPLAASEDSDATNVETDLSSDGRQILITYSQVGAKYRLLAAELCE